MEQTILDQTRSQSVDDDSNKLGTQMEASTTPLQQEADELIVEATEPTDIPAPAPPQPEHTHVQKIVKEELPPPKRFSPPWSEAEDDFLRYSAGCLVTGSPPWTVPPDFASTVISSRELCPWRTVDDITQRVNEMLTRGEIEPVTAHLRFPVVTPLESENFVHPLEDYAHPEGTTTAAASSHADRPSSWTPSSAAGLRSRYKRAPYSPNSGRPLETHAPPIDFPPMDPEIHLRRRRRKARARSSEHMAEEAQQATETTEGPPTSTHQHQHEEEEEELIQMDESDSQHVQIENENDESSNLLLANENSQQSLDDAAKATEFLLSLSKASEEVELEGSVVQSQEPAVVETPTPSGSRPRRTPSSRQQSDFEYQTATTTAITTSPPQPSHSPSKSATPTKRSSRASGGGGGRSSAGSRRPTRRGVGIPASSFGGKGGRAVKRAKDEYADEDDEMGSDDAPYNEEELEEDEEPSEPASHHHHHRKRGVTTRSKAAVAPPPPAQLPPPPLVLHGPGAPVAIRVLLDEGDRGGLRALQNPYLQCSSGCTIFQIKQLLAEQLHPRLGTEIELTMENKVLRQQVMIQDILGAYNIGPENLILYYRTKMQ